MTEKPSLPTGDPARKAASPVRGSDAAAGGRADRVWFITGCSSGFGRALVEQLLRRGDRVAMTAREPAVLADLVAIAPERALACRLDVRDRAQIDAAVGAAEARFGAIDVLVNNAGHGYSAAIEEGLDDSIRDMFETNVFGLAAVIRRVLPGMRARGRGHIVNIGSITGLQGFPASGYYSATKFAVEGLSDALAAEVEPLGIRVTVIEPGGFRTRFADAVVRPEGELPAYSATAGAFKKMSAANHGRQPGDPEQAVRAIIAVVESGDPPHRLVLGNKAVDVARAKLRRVLADIDAWEETSRGADYPEPALALEAPEPAG